ncbi:LysR family transcriptional regulator [Brevibacillus agri]|uniref:LysR family transcriptional regulator n=1 Tax=Brevibacillus agri TaxID=51101 RepID=UPI003D72605E
MNIQQLRVFAVAAQCKSLTEAAEALGIKQPTVSFHLKKLETALGVELFYKQPRHFRLTEAGNALLPYARRVSTLLTEAGQIMEEFRHGGRGTLKIGASYTPATYFLPPYLAAFQAEYPHVLPILTVKKARPLMELLRDFEIDLAIVSLSMQPQEGLHVIPLLADELRLVLSPQNPLAQKKTIELADLQSEPFLIHEAGSTSRELAERWAQENQLRWQVRMELGAIETIKEATKHNMGVSTLPYRSVVREGETGELVIRELPGYVNRRHICLVYRQDDLLPYPVTSFIRFLQHRRLPDAKSPSPL